jgi:SpoVK/Ycf46/Vps4 family AAA+-type ATPase
MGSERAPRLNWSQLGLPDDSLQQLRALCSAVRSRSGERALTVLFAGTSRTAIAAAEALAVELGLPLLRVALGGIVSRGRSEAEGSLERVFEAGASSGSILFFEEADALFEDRTRVKDSHDRYAGLEISYLLQKLQHHEGVAILAIERQPPLAHALRRRFTFTVIFP